MSVPAFANHKSRRRVALLKYYKDYMSGWRRNAINSMLIFKRYTVVKTSVSGLTAARGQRSVTTLCNLRRTCFRGHVKSSVKIYDMHGRLANHWWICAMNWRRRKTLTVFSARTRTWNHDTWHGCVHRRARVRTKSHRAYAPTHVCTHARAHMYVRTHVRAYTDTRWPAWVRGIYTAHTNTRLHHVLLSRVLL